MIDMGVYGKVSNLINDGGGDGLVYTVTIPLDHHAIMFKLGWSTEILKVY
jgi:hypothetical protein